MPTYNALRLNKNDQKKRRTLLSFIIPKGTTPKQASAGLLLGYTQENCVVASISGYNTTTGEVQTINNFLKIGNAIATANKFYGAVQPIVFRNTNLNTATTDDIVVVIDLLEVFNTDGYLVGPNTANSRAPLDDAGQPCVEFPDVTPNTRAF